MAHNTPSKEKHKILIGLLELLEVAEVLLPVATFAFPAFNLILRKLEIRSKALFTKALSEAEAGVVGIESTKSQRAEENHEFAPSSCSPL